MLLSSILIVLAVVSYNSGTFGIERKSVVLIYFKFSKLGIYQKLAFYDNISPFEHNSNAIGLH